MSSSTPELNPAQNPRLATATDGTDDQTYRFLSKVLPTQGHYFIAVVRPEGGFTHFCVDSIAEASALARKFDLEGATVYHACASYRSSFVETVARDPQTGEEVRKRRQRVQENVAFLKSFWLDIDVGADDAQKYPTVKDAIIFGLAEFLKQTSLPIPMVVLSGGGLHCYWTLDKDITPELWCPTARALKLLVTRCGFKADPSRTADHASVLRPVGTHNRKGGLIRPVGLFYDKPPVSFESFRESVYAACRDKGVDLADQSSPDINAGAGFVGDTSTTYPPSYGENIARECNQVRQMRDTRGNVSEPVWYGVIQILDKTVEGEKLIHEWSKGHPNYTPDETNRKISQVKPFGPTSCATMEARNPEGCMGCPHKGKITSPIQLGWKEASGIPKSETPQASISGLDALDHLNTLYAWIDKQPAIFRFEHFNFIRLQDFHTALANKDPVRMVIGGKEKQMPLAEAWLKWPRRRNHRDVVYEPGQPPIVNDCVNLWKGWGCDAMPGDISPWNQLMDLIFAGDQVARKYFEQWNAYPIQHPGEKLYTAIVLWSGQQGVGKTLVGETVGRLFGENFTVISAAELHSQFNSWARGRQLVLGEENASNDHRADANKLKHLITGETIRINEKYQPAVALRNTLNFIFTSNNPDAFHVDTHDRRFFVWEITRERLPDEFYRDFVDWRDNRGGLRALMHHFLHLDLTGFNAKAAAPMTRAKSDMVDLSRSDLERWLFDQINGGAATSWAPSEVVTLDDLVQQYRLKTENRATTTAVGKALSRLRLRQARRVTVKGVRCSLTAIRRLDYWGVADNEAWAAEYAKPALDCLSKSSCQAA